MFRSIVYRLLFSLAPAFLLAGCQKFIEVPNPSNQILASDVFATDAAADAAMAGVYSQLMRYPRGIGNAGLHIYPALSADELHSTAPSAEYDPLLHNSLLPTQVDVLNNLWNNAYQPIYQCNALLEGLSGPHGLSPAAAQQLAGEARFTRAFLYFQLLQLFGDVPLILGTDYDASSIAPRTARATVYQQILADLAQAIDQLPATSAGRLRPTHWAARALLARVHLYLGHWELAAATAGQVLDAGGFPLVSDPDRVFLLGSTETIWQLYPVTALSNTTALLFLPLNASTVPAFRLTDALWYRFPAGDARAARWVRSVTLNGQSYHYPFKYKDRSGASVTENNIVFRSAELYLLRAEARAQLGDPAGALADLNRVHQRAGLPALAGLTPAALLSAIEQERSLELFTEWGHRWMDLKRTGRADAVLGSLKGADWQPTDQLYPIPQEDLLRNVFLVQNPGY